MENKQILNYKLIREIGEGGMAKVYEAEHIRLGNKVAIKILDEVLLKKSNIKERFENEAKIMAGLEHQNIVRVIDFEETDSSLAIVMELIKGISLKDYINQNGALKPEEAIKLQKTLLETFAYAHHRGIVHRDVKPSNIIIETDKNNNPKILDFGIAKLLQSDANLTSTGMQMGTPLYMSPEQVKDAKDINHRSDIYSLGVVFYYMLAGKAPYDSSTMSNFDIFSKIVHEPMPTLEKYPKFNQIIEKATAKVLENRYQSCEEFIVNIEAFERPSSVSTDKDDKTKIHEPVVVEDETKIELDVKTRHALSQQQSNSFQQQKNNQEHELENSPENKEKLKKKIKKSHKTFLWTYLIGGILFIFGVFLANEIDYELGITVMNLASISFIISFILSFIILHKGWKSIQNKNAYTTANKAVGYLFIPFFNIYWSFIAYRRLFIDMNTYTNTKNANSNFATFVCIIAAISLIYVSLIYIDMSFYYILHIPPFYMYVLNLILMPILLTKIKNNTLFVLNKK